MGCPRCVVAAVAAFVGTSVTVAQAKPIVTSDDHVELRLHPGDLTPELARRLVDEGWATVQQVLPLLKKAGCLPEHRITIEVYGDITGYRAVQSRSRLEFPVEEFAEPLAATAHVALWPELSVEVLAVIGLPPDTRDAIVRQLGWLAAAQTEVGIRDAWLCQVFAAGLLDAIDDPDLAYGVDPRFDARRTIYKGMAAAGKPFTLGEWVDWNGVPADRGTWDASWEMAGWCAQLMAQKSSSWSKKVLKANAKAKKLNAVPDVRRAIFVGMLGSKWDKVEAKLQQEVADAALGWAAVLPAAARRGQRLVLAGTAEKEGRLWHIGAVPAGPFAIRGRVEVADVGKRQWRIAFLHADSLLIVVFGSEVCLVSEWVDGDWREIGRFDAREERLGKIEFAVEVRKELHLLIDGEQVLQVPYGSHRMREYVAVEAFDSLIWLQDLRIDALPAPR